ncbi:MAG: L-rhamnose isomerase, partial [Bacteroidales bacterium]|nr:L-rhamnose isomerase [Bacteroidales bacterium]
MNEQKIIQAYEMAKERYAAIGVDTDKAIAELEKQQISLHCWQTDDVGGFENDGSLTGGIQATGNYPGKARNIEEVRSDLEFVKTLLAGNHRVNLHEIYGDFGGKFVDRDEVEVKHFQSWIEWAKANNFKLDFNSTSFSHPKSGDLSLANPDKAIRDFWIDHTIRCRKIADAMGKAQNDPCIMNIWVHDGQKDFTVNRKKYREILAESLDEILKEDLPGMKSCVEAKLFGIGLESYTVGSMDFYEGYCATRKVIYTLDTGHYEPTENVADKVSALLLYVPELMLHVSRPVRWDSDHVTIMNDMTLEFFKELVRSDGLHRAHVGLDYFDGAM